MEVGELCILDDAKQGMQCSDKYCMQYNYVKMLTYQCVWLLEAFCSFKNVSEYRLISIYDTRNTSICFMDINYTNNLFMTLKTVNQLIQANLTLPRKIEDFSERVDTSRLDRWMRLCKSCKLDSHFGPLWSLSWNG